MIHEARALHVSLDLLHSEINESITVNVSSEIQFLGIQVLACSPIRR